MTASFRQSTGLSIVARPPLVSSAKSPIDDTLANLIESFSFEKAALGGYWKMDFTMKGSQLDVEDWLSEGLARHVEVYNESLEKIFEGFVNFITADLGGLSSRRGPLLDIANRVKIFYTTIRYDTVPPTGGVATVTAVANDTTSQGKYYILEKSLSIGEKTSTEAEQARDSYLADYKNPQSGEDLNLGGGASEPTVRVEILGYVHLLDQFTYNNDTASGTINLSQKISNVLAADPNALFTAANSSLTTNTFQVAAYEDGNRTGWEILKELVSFGDTSDNRYILQVGNERKVTYEAAPTTYAYQHRLSDPAQQVVDVTESVIFYWNVEAGAWVLIPDFLIGKAIPTAIREDPRAIFGESVRFTTPYQIQITGGKVDKVSQRLARLGLGGV